MHTVIMYSMTCIEPSLHKLDFFLEIFLWRLVSVLFFAFNLLCGAAHAHLVDESSLHMCTNEWRPTASTLCPLSLPRNKVQAVNLSYPQSKAQMHHPQSYWWLF